MSIPTVTITGNVLPPNNVAAGGTVSFELSTVAVDLGSGVVVPRKVSTPILSGGAISQAIWPNAAGEGPSRYSVYLEMIPALDGDCPVRIKLGEIVIPVSPSTQDIGALIAAGASATGGGALLEFQFANRAALVLAISEGLVPIPGFTYFADGLAYLGQTGTTAIPDLPGLVPAPLVASIAWDDVTDKPATFPPSAHTHPVSAISDSTAAGRAMVTAADAPAQRALLSVETSTQLNARDAANRARAGHTGTQAISTISGLQSALDGKQPLATVLTNTTAAFTTAQETKLAGIATGATANATDAALRDRSTHTGTQPASTITGLATVATSGDYDDLSGLPTLGGAAALNVGTTAGTVAAGNDSRMTNSREWTATTISQAEAEAGTATTRRAFTAQRVRQANLAWWNGSADKTKLDGIATGATANAADSALRDRATHTGTQLASTISDLEGAVSGLLGRISPEQYGAVGDGTTDDGAALEAMFAAGEFKEIVFRAGAVYRSDRLLTLPPGNFAIQSNGATIDFSNRAVNGTGTYLGLSGSTGTPVAISNIATSTASSKEVVVTVTTSGAHGRAVGEDVLLSSDDVIDIGHDATNEKRGQFATVTSVPSSTTFTILQPIYEALDTSPVMTPITWRENFAILGHLHIKGPGRRTSGGAIGLGFLYCRDFHIDHVSADDVDMQTISLDNCIRVTGNYHFARFSAQGAANENIQYGLTFKNACTDVKWGKLVVHRGKHAFDATRNTNPGIGRNNRIEHILAYGTWEALAAMHGNARNCSIGYAEGYNCLYGVNIRAPGWRVDDAYLSNGSEVVRLTDNPLRVSLGSVRGKDVNYGLRVTDADFIGTREAGDITCGLVEVENCVHAVQLNLNTIPVFTEADAAVTGGTTTTVTFGDLPVAMYNNTGALVGSEIVIDRDGGGSAGAVTRVITGHTYSGGTNTLTFSAIAGAPTAGVATYTIRSFVDNITIDRIVSRNANNADLSVTGNVRRLRVGAMDVSHETVTAQPSVFIQTTAENYAQDVVIGPIAAVNKLDPNIGANATGVRYTLTKTTEQGFYGAPLVANDGAVLNGDISGTGVQSNSTDATSGRLLKIDGANGAFGLGGVGTLVTDYSAPLGQSQFIAGSGGSAIDPPPNGGAYWPGLVARRAFSNRASILNFTATGLAMRNYTDDVPNIGWLTIFSQQNILGTVSQSGGVPTGAVIESGSNANGEYVRFADGTQICRISAISVSAITTAIGALFRPAGVSTWTFPAAFVANPVAMAAVDDPDCITSSLTPTTTSVGIRTLSLLSKAGPVNVRGLAIGRWF